MKSGFYIHTDRNVSQRATRFFLPPYSQYEHNTVSYEYGWKAGAKRINAMPSAPIRRRVYGGVGPSRNLTKEEAADGTTRKRISSLQHDVLETHPSRTAATCIYDT